MRHLKFALFASSCFALGAAVGPKAGELVSQSVQAGEEQGGPKSFVDLSKHEFRNAKPTGFAWGPSLYYVAYDSESAKPLLVCVANLKMQGEVRRKGEINWHPTTYQQVCMCAASHGKLPTKEDLYFGPKDDQAYIGFVPQEWLDEWKETNGDKPPETVRQWLDWAQSRGHAVPEKYRRKK